MEEQQTAILTASIVITLLVILMLLLFVIFQRKKNRLLQEQDETKEQFKKIINLDITLEELLYTKNGAKKRNTKVPQHSIEKPLVYDSAPQVTTKDTIDLEEITKTILKRLQQFEQNKGFLNSGISVHNLAKQIQTNSKYLSKTINIHKGKKFTTYINDLRIQYAKDRLTQDTTFRKYTIASIAVEIGFNTPHTFSNAFYKHTNMHPSDFIKQLEDDSTTIS